MFELSSVNVDIFSEGTTKSIHGEHLLVKTLPKVFKQRYGTIPKTIYVRDCYRELYKIATDSMVDASLDNCATLFTGVPGIGKSLFMVYFISRFLVDERFTDKSFALEFTAGKYVYFRPTGEEGEFWCSFQDGTYMLSKDFLLLCDIVATVEPVARAKWTYIFSSPDPKRYKQILKNFPNHRYTLPTWSELELMLLSADRPVSEWYNDFVLFGGVPRYIFSGKDSRNLLSTALNEKGRALVEWFFKFGSCTSTPLSLLKVTSTTAG